MAEALLQLYYADRFEVVSAGSRACGYVHPLAIQAMRELGSNMEGAHSKSAELFRDDPFDVVVTLCDSAARDCPTWPGAKRIVHWSIPDPSYGPDDPATRFDRFKATRNDLKHRIDELVATME